MLPDDILEFVFETRPTPLLEALTVDIACLGVVFVSSGVPTRLRTMPDRHQTCQRRAVFHSQPAATTVEISISSFLFSQNYKGVGHAEPFSYCPNATVKSGLFGGFQLFRHLKQLRNAVPV